MTKTFHEQWRQFKAGKAGRRFQDHYERHRRQGANSNVARILLWLAAVVSFAVGIILVFIPGPAVVFFFVTGALLATESRSVAVFMDWAEVKIRAVVRWARLTWTQMSNGTKTATVLAIAGTGAGLAYASFQLFIAR